MRRPCLDGVVDVGAGLEDAGVDAQEGEGAHEGVRHDLEGEAREGLGVRGLAGQQHLLVVHLGAVRQGLTRVSTCQLNPSDGRFVSFCQRFVAETTTDLISRKRLR